MSVSKYGRALARAVATVVLCLPSLPQAAAVPPAPGSWNETFNTRFDPTTRETRVSGRVAPQVCFSFDLPQEWRSVTQGLETRLKAAASNAEIEIGLRSAHELQHMPQPDLASRDAAFLQRGYEDLLGRPAQAVSLASSAAGATRWSATWIDANLPADSHAVTVEAFIVPLSNEWVLELSLSNIDAREVHDALAQRLLTGLRVRNGSEC